MPYFLTLDDIERIAFRYAQIYLTYDEPIPPFKTRFPNQLETALRIPQQSLGGTLWMHISQDDLYNLAVRVAYSKPNHRDTIIRDLTGFFEKNVRDEEL